MIPAFPRRHPVTAVVLLVGLLVGSMFAPETMRAVSSTVVISEFRVRGPNGGSDEFVELYNLSSAPVNIGGWKIRGSNASGTIGDRLTIAAGTTLGAGCHFLATNSSTSGGPYSGAVPGDQTYATGVTDDGGIALTLADNTIVDQVGLSAGSAFKEGTPLASLGSSNLNRGYERKPGGAAGSATDTDDNALDFQLLTPSDPQNLTSACVAGDGPTGVGAADPAVVFTGGSVRLSVAVTPGTPPQPITSVVGNLTAIGGGAAASFFDDGTHGDQVSGDLTFTLDTTVAPATSPGVKSLPVTITDALLRSGGASISLTVVLATPFVAIHDIQGSGSASPYAGQAVKTQGIVTARRFNNGFFMQVPDADVDANSNSSEAIFVFTSAAPPAAAAVGNLVEVVGTVTEFIPGGDLNSPPVTELTAPTVTLLTSAVPLPSAVVIDSTVVNPAAAFDALERFEGMRVHVDSLLVVAPTDGTVTEPAATATSNGVFFGVLPGAGRPFREPGVVVPDPLPPGSPANVPRFDSNPERLRIDSDGQVGAIRIEVTTGAVVSAIVGVLDYAFRAYSILPDPAPAPAVSGGMFIGAVRAPAADEIMVASANLERFFDTVDDPGVGDAVLTPAAFNMRLAKLSLIVRKVLRSPDIIGVQEVENLATLQAIAARLNADTMAFGFPNPGYVGYLEEGNDPGGIDVGVLVKSSRVAVLSVTQVGKDARFTDPRDGSLDLLNDRPPLVLHAEVGSGGAMTVIVNHLRSLNGIDDASDPPGANWVRVKRRAQAEFVADVIQARQSADPVEPVVVIGDFNAFQFSDGYVDVMGTIRGAPAPGDEVVLPSLDLVLPNLTELAELAPPEHRYSYVFDGNAQLLDHIVVSASALPFVSGIDWGRCNADFPESLRSSAFRPERLSDHDPIVAYFRFQ